jgi:UDP-4-amino-4,6-dideoxy-N-acetyl-beta-L-altrosamine N-acetyltransferase
MPLRPLAEKDLPLIRAWRNAPEVRGNMYSKHEITKAEHQAWFTRLRDDAQSRWFIHEDAVGQPDGVVYFTQLQPDQGNAFLGFYANTPAKPGVGMHIAFDSLEIAFNELNLHKLNCEVLMTNWRVINLYKKLGFKEEGIFRDCHFNGENYVDVTRLGILASEWMAIGVGIQLRLTKLNALAQRSVIRGGYKIMILTDRHSWIDPYIDDLAEEWSAAGHDCKIAHNANDAEFGDFCFCLSFSQIVPATVRRQFKNTLVVHESDLPHGRGWAPMTWQILAGSRRIPVTLLEAVDAVDAGPIYLQEWIELEGTELNHEWRKLQAETTLRLCAEWVRNYPAVLDGARDQVGVSSFYPRRRPEDSQLDISKSLIEQFDLLRTVDNEAYPAFFEVADVKYKISLTKSN